MKYFATILFLGFNLFLFAQPAADEGMSFSGSNSYNGIPDTNYINLASPLYNRTIELSFKATGVTAKQVLFEEGAQVNSMLIYIENGYLIVGAYRDDGNEAIFFRRPININQWYHVALVLDTGSVLRWYLDGTFQDEDTNAFPIPKHTGNVNLGRSDGDLRYANCGTWTNNKCEDSTAQSNSNNYFTGLIWGFRVWNSVRTETEINANKSIIISDETNSDLAAYMSDSYDEIRYKASTGIFDSETSTNTTPTLSIEDYDYLAKDVAVFVAENILYTRSNLERNIVGVKLYSIQGREVFTSKFNNEIELPNLSTGIYYILFGLEDGVLFGKKVLLQ